jgi:hypothetical protein
LYDFWWASPESNQAPTDYESGESKTIGYGDIAPIRAPATTLAMMEAVIGQFYIAVAVAQLVDARLSNPARQNSGDS